MPLIIEALKNKNLDVKIRSYAAYALAEMGTDAEAAIPTLEVVSTDKNQTVSKAAKMALQQIKLEPTE